eukprot:gene7652-9116_t
MGRRNKKHNITSATPVVYDLLDQGSFQDPSGGSNQLVLQKKKKDDVAEKKPSAPAAPVVQLSKSQKKKLKFLDEMRAKKKQRAAAYDALAKTSLASDKQRLLKQSGDLGKKETTRGALKRSLLREKHGILSDADFPLTRSVFAPEPSATPDGPDVAVPEPIAATSATSAGSVGIQCQKVDGSDEDDGDDHEVDDVDEEDVDEEDAKEEESTRARVSQGVAEPSTERVPAAPALSKEALRHSKKQILETLERDPEDDDGKVALRVAQPKPLTDGALKKFVVHVKRPDDVVEARVDLPIVGMEQVPQFLYEAGFGSKEVPERSGIVGVCQPRRVAATSTAARVAYELGVKLGQEVGSHVRYERMASKKTKLKFMTDGILLRELQADFLLRQYSCIVVDEAHERSLNTDILIGNLSRIVPLRQKLFEQQRPAPPGDEAERVMPLKLIIMSATLRVDDFLGNQRLFRTPPPLINVPARQFPVSIHFSRLTEMHDYLNVALKKTCDIHTKLPRGGILVFVTGQREVDRLCRQLRQSLSGRRQAPQAPEEAEVKGQGGEDSQEAALEELFSADTLEAQGELGGTPLAAAPMLPYEQLLLRCVYVWGWGRRISEESEEEDVDMDAPDDFDEDAFLEEEEEVVQLHSVEVGADGGRLQAGDATLVERRALEDG